jgi:hypothetical protein
MAGQIRRRRRSVRNRFDASRYRRRAMILDVAELVIRKNGKRVITMQRCVAWLLAIASLLIVRPSLAFEGVEITGTAEKLQIELSNATVDNALAALRSTFGVKCRCPASGRRVTGVYRGNIRGVLSRLLEGEDYVIKASPSGDLEVIALGTNASPQPNPVYSPSGAAGPGDEARGRGSPNLSGPSPSYAAAPATAVGDETRGRGPPGR